jgi:hypothetical protein
MNTSNQQLDHVIDVSDMSGIMIRHAIRRPPFHFPLTTSNWGTTDPRLFYYWGRRPAPQTGES